jgi:hypothetical protein
MNAGPEQPATDPERGRRMVRAAIWLPGLAVALGAAVATAHGLYEVAAAARVPSAIAWLYPLITDGLALVAYTATARLHSSARRYAWAVVVLAAGLSGLAQASYLASDAAGIAGAEASVLVVAPALRFGVGAWPAIAAAMVAHLLYLLAAEPGHPAGDRDRSREGAGPEAAFNGSRSTAGVQPQLFNPPAEQSVVQAAASNAPLSLVSFPAGTDDVAAEAFNESSQSDLNTVGDERATAPPAETPARDRARKAAAQHVARHGALPTVSELETAAQVSRGTAATVLKTLRKHPTAPRQAPKQNPEPGEARDQT